jgi:potassium efflux system protein
MPGFSDAFWMQSEKSSPPHIWVASWMIALLLFAAAAPAQEAAVPERTVAPIPVAAIAAEASTLESFLRGVESDLTTPAALVEIAEKLPTADAALLELSHRTDERLERGYNRTDLESLSIVWQNSSHDLSSWESVLNSRLTNLNSARSQLIEREAIWKDTAAAAVEESAPVEIRSQIASERKSLQSTSIALRKSRDEALALQKRVIALQSRVTAGRDALELARDEVLSQMFSRHQPSIWDVRFEEQLDVAQNDFEATLNETRLSIGVYAKRASTLIFLHVILILLMVWASSMARIWMGRPPLYGTRPVPDALIHPIAAGLVLGLSASMWLYSEAPPKLGLILGLLALPFLYFVLRSLLPENFRRPMIGLFLVVLFDFGRRVLMDFDFIARMILILEAGTALAGLIWLRRPKRLAEVAGTENPFWVRSLGIWLHLALLGTTISVFGAVFGWMIVTDLVMTALVVGTYIGAILLTATLVLEAIAEASVYSGKLDGIRVLRNHRKTFLVVLSRTVRAVSFATWLIYVLERLAIRDITQKASMSILDTPIGYGSVQLTLGGLGAFVITLWVSWLLARFISATLEAEMFSRISLPRGVPYALSTITRYTILVLGFIIAVAMLGFKVSNLALLVSALGVGIGFGMQNMVNNFISGLILLFERPIKAGDLVSLDQLLGTVTRIGIRSSTIRAFDGADVIVPNGDLISNRVTNWTLADKHRRVSLPVGVTYGTPARKVIELLEEVARAHPDIIAKPAPSALFTGFGDSSLDFELRAWSESVDALSTVRSDLAVGVQEALAAAGIEVPFPQRDVYLKEVSKKGPVADRESD